MPPCDAPPSAGGRTGRQKRAAITLDELNARFLPLPSEEREGRGLTGLIWLAAMEALVQLPERPERQIALEHLAQAADIARDLMAPATAS